MIDSERIKREVSIEAVVSHFIKLEPDGREFVGLCPFHNEKTPSLKVTPSNGLFTCFGCDAGGDAIDFVQKLKGGISFQDAVAIVAEIGGIDLPTKKAEPPPKPQIVATYPYTNEHGEFLYEVCRIEPGEHGKRKTFRQRRQHTDGAWVWGISAGGYYKNARTSEWYPCKKGDAGEITLPEVRRVLLDLPAVLKADTVWLVEGEKDARTIQRLGLTATTPSGGAKAPWLADFTEALRNKHVILLPDGDETGRARSETISEALQGAAASLTILFMPEGAKDVTEWMSQPRGAKGDEGPRGLEDLTALLDQSAELAREKEYQRRGLLSPEEVLSRIKGGVYVFLDPTKREKGILTGYQDFDDLTLGFHRGELTILAARPAMGKTAMALNLTERVAEKTGQTVAFFSLEMNSDALLQRMVCTRARLDMQRFRAGVLDPEEKKRAQRALLELLKLPIRFDDTAGCKLENIEAKLKMLCQREELGMVIVDYLQLMLSSGKSENRNYEVGALSRGLKLMSKQFQVPFLVLSQLSRKLEERQDKRPMLSDLRESGEIEQNADNVEFVFRPEVYLPNDASLKGLADLIVAKQRQGPTGTLDFIYLAESLRFEPRVEDYKKLEEPKWAA